MNTMNFLNKFPNLYIFIIYGALASFMKFFNLYIYIYIFFFILDQTKQPQSYCHTHVFYW